jgi:hypothetical protein
MRIDWTSGIIPLDEPQCGFMNEHCTKDDGHVVSMVVAGVLGLILFCSIVITISIYRKWKIELEIEGLLWKIEPHEIKGFFNNDIVSSPSKVCHPAFSIANRLSIIQRFSLELAQSRQCRQLWIAVFKSGLDNYRSLSWRHRSHKRTQVHPKERHVTRVDERIPHASRIKT